MFLKDLAISNLVGLEIGVEKGDNALSILLELPMTKLFLVDSYIPYLDSGIYPTTFESDFKVAMERIVGLSNVEFIRKTSDEAVSDIDKPLDFAYIDGNHSYEYVKRDIANYYPLVKPNGVLGGHDYAPKYSTAFPYCQGVVDAVNEFVKEHSKEKFFTALPADWWIVKS